MAPQDVTHVGVLTLICSCYVVLVGFRSSSFTTYAAGCFCVFAGLVMALWNI